jgi:hypothetical protein
VDTGSLFPQGKSCHVELCTLLATEVKKECSFTSIFPCVCMVWCLMRCRDNLPFPLLGYSGDTVYLTSIIYFLSLEP